MEPRLVALLNYAVRSGEALNPTLADRLATGDATELRLRRMRHHGLRVPVGSGFTALVNSMQGRVAQASLQHALAQQRERGELANFLPWMLERSKESPGFGFGQAETGDHKFAQAVVDLAGIDCTVNFVELKRDVAAYDWSRTHHRYTTAVLSSEVHAVALIVDHQMGTFGVYDSDARSPVKEWQAEAVERVRQGLSRVFGRSLSKTHYYLSSGFNNQWNSGMCAVYASACAALIVLNPDTDASLTVRLLANMATGDLQRLALVAPALYQCDTVCVKHPQRPAFRQAHHILHRILDTTAVLREDARTELGLTRNLDALLDNAPCYRTIYAMLRGGPADTGALAWVEAYGDRQPKKPAFAALCAKVPGVHDDAEVELWADLVRRFGYGPFLALCSPINVWPHSAPEIALVRLWQYALLAPLGAQRRALIERLATQTVQPEDHAAAQATQVWPGRCLIHAGHIYELGLHFPFLAHTLPKTLRIGPWPHHDSDYDAVCLNEILTQPDSHPDDRRKAADRFVGEMLWFKTRQLADARLAYAAAAAIAHAAQKDAEYARSQPEPVPVVDIVIWVILMSERARGMGTGGYSRPNSVDRIVQDLEGRRVSFLVETAVGFLLLLYPMPDTEYGVALAGIDQSLDIQRAELAASLISLRARHRAGTAHEVVSFDFLCELGRTYLRRPPPPLAASSNASEATELFEEEQ